MYSEFQDKVVLVTGAAQGIGKAVVDALLLADARVIAADIQYTNHTLATSGNFYPIHLDVNNSQAVNQLISQIEKQVGAVDYLASIAGILRMNSLLETTDKEWQETFAVNTTGSFYVCRAVARAMVLRQRGAIVAVSSNAAQVPRINMGAYAASKAALSQLIKCLGLELAQHNIRCNLVSPGSTDTDMQRQLWKDSSGPAHVIKGSLENYRTGIPLQRIATPEMVAKSILFLLSENAAHITMENILVDGGATLGC